MFSIIKTLIDLNCITKLLINVKIIEYEKNYLQLLTSLEGRLLINKYLICTMKVNFIFVFWL